MEYNYEPHKLKWWHAPLLLLLIAGTLYVVHERRSNHTEGEKAWKQKDVQRCEGMVFGTFYHITYQYSKSLEDSIKCVLQQVDRSLSPFNKESTITAINENKQLEADEMLTEVFEMATEISAQTEGAFDITVAPLVNLWGFGFQNKDSVTDEMVDELRQYVGIEKVKLIDGKIQKAHPNMMLDCSAIAKGYGVDAVGKMLERQGIHSYMVEIGGEVRLRGCNPRGENWSIGINKPQDGQQADIEQIIHTTNTAMATSGNYRNFYVKEGKKFAHTIDPRTGYPVQHNILSSTVLAKDCAVADAYATSFMVLGLDSAKRVLNKHPELQAFFIYSTKDGKTGEWCSPNLKKLLSK
ncbi:MAG: FAD:protein FMN transferase [Bacteroidaceae bacterium]|nr:FAD:protein FMN transferase [Bacteroidaceae bacterium]